MRTPTNTASFQPSNRNRIDSYRIGLNTGSSVLLRGTLTRRMLAESNSSSTTEVLRYVLKFPTKPSTTSTTPHIELEQILDDDRSPTPPLKLKSKTISAPESIPWPQRKFPAKKPVDILLSRYYAQPVAKELRVIRSSSTTETAAAEEEKKVEEEGVEEELVSAVKTASTIAEPNFELRLTLPEARWCFFRDLSIFEYPHASAPANDVAEALNNKNSQQQQHALVPAWAARGWSAPGAELEGVMQTVMRLLERHAQQTTVNENDDAEVETELEMELEITKIDDGMPSIRRNLPAHQLPRRRSDTDLNASCTASAGKEAGIIVRGDEVQAFASANSQVSDLLMIHHGESFSSETLTAAVPPVQEVEILPNLVASEPRSGEVPVRPPPIYCTTGVQTDDGDTAQIPTVVSPPVIISRPTTADQSRPHTASSSSGSSSVFAPLAVRAERLLHDFHGSHNHHHHHHHSHSSSSSDSEEHGGDGKGKKKKRGFVQRIRDKRHEITDGILGVRMHIRHRSRDRGSDDGAEREREVLEVDSEGRLQPSSGGGSEGTGPTRRLTPGSWGSGRRGHRRALSGGL